MIVLPLDRAKQYNVLPISAGDQLTRTENALIPATALFESKYHRYVALSYMPASFDSITVTQIDDDFITVELEKKIIKQMQPGYRLRVETGNYAGAYDVLSVDKTNNTIRIEAEYFNEIITFENAELQLYYDALAWYIVGFVTLTQQEIQELKVLITSTQSGNGNSTQYSQQSIAKYRADRIADGDRLLLSRHYPSVC